MDLQDLKQKIPEIFEKVKNDVRKITGRHRAGLSLRLAEMGKFRGGFIGGMHFYPGTEIIMNLSPLKAMFKKDKPYEIIWAYTYHILLHEYIHSLGVLNEKACQTNTTSISEQIFKDRDHWAIKIAKYGLGVAFPDLKIKIDDHDWQIEGIPIEYVDGFDKESQSYFS
ncbi:MAG: hypothetical protein ACXABG_06910 [Promethearchaeota archaeon]|jgi:hypothetical protein